MPKSMPGFEAVKYKQTGVLFLIVGVALMMTKVLSYVTDWFFAPNFVLYFGIVLALIGAYLIIFVPRDK